MIKFITLLSIVLALCACKEPPNSGHLGYIEGEYIYVSSQIAGRLVSLAVNHGDSVEKGQQLFSLDDTPEKTAFTESAHHLDQSRARLSNLTKGKRPTELAALQAELQSVRANLNLAEETLKRKNQLIKKQVISKEELDAARFSRDALSSQIVQISSEIETAKLGAREDEIAAAQAEVSAFEASLQKAAWALEQKTVMAPESGLIEDTLYRPGEYVPAGSPIVSLLPPQNIKVRFFVPETMLSELNLGSRVFAYLDNAPEPVTATINFISPRAEFTPPVIFSNQSRSKLVYLVEAHPDGISSTNEVRAPRSLHPGQPVTVFISESK